MTTIAQDEPRRVTGGVDTHKDIHVAAVLDEIGRLIATASFPATRHGYRRMLRWLRSHGELVSVGVEGCGSWGAGLARFLAERGVTVIEVNRPNRQNRRLRGKSDTVDAEAAARAVLNGQATVTPKAGTGPVEAVRQLRIARSGAMKARTAAANQLHSLCDTAPDQIRAQLAGVTLRKKVALAERWRPGNAMTADVAAKRALMTVARRWRALDEEARELSRHIKAILDDIAAPLLAVPGVGYETAGQLLVTAGDNPERLGHEKSFAALCGSSPVQASSGRTNRHRLNRGGDRHANSALWTIVLVRMGTHAPTKNYVARRTAEGLSKPEIMRCLKRYVARELFPLIQHITAPLALEKGDAEHRKIAA
jgi:transposase